MEQFKQLLKQYNIPPGTYHVEIIRIDEPAMFSFGRTNNVRYFTHLDKYYVPIKAAMAKSLPRKFIITIGE
jgi:hypothetical protein